MLRQQQISVIVALVILSFAFAISAGSIVIELGEVLEEDQDIYIREYSNSSCTFFRSLFAKEYRINETTTCKCVRTNWTRCSTTHVFNTTTTTSATTSEVPTTRNSLVIEEIMNAVDETEQRRKGYADADVAALAFNYWN